MEFESFDGISFCIPTNGQNREKTIIEIKSIKRAMAKATIPYEIVLAGDTDRCSDVQGIKLLSYPKDAHEGLVAKLRNIAASASKYDVLVFVDDDFVFDENWALRLLDFSTSNWWDVLGNKILLPDGGRYWDRATVYPHRMIDYDDTDYQGILYQTGGYLVLKRRVYANHAWDSSIGFYAEKSSGLNEDVEYSLRLQRHGYTIAFDKENVVWHYDDSYITIGEVCVNKDNYYKENGMPDIAGQALVRDEFKNLINILKSDIDT